MNPRKEFLQESLGGPLEVLARLNSQKNFQIDRCVNLQRELGRNLRKQVRGGNPGKDSWKNLREFLEVSLELLNKSPSEIAGGSTEGFLPVSNSLINLWN